MFICDPLLVRTLELAGEIIDVLHKNECTLGEAERARAEALQIIREKSLVQVPVKPPYSPIPASFPDCIDNRRKD